MCPSAYRISGPPGPGGGGGIKTALKPSLDMRGYASKFH